MDLEVEVDKVMLPIKIEQLQHDIDEQSDVMLRLDLIQQRIELEERLEALL